ncbi:isoprenylcysteine carboxyl methyltransferase family protein [Pasteurella bettyae]|uniref:Isoprenylcysteine carboxyl methyltransferase family protein n=1 Tax=Pasteurella bettyae CCUG 2042 TaxID=1095749 RepID=I3DHI5_9PAST|nr:isoprenylcysteine carboxyl methyltransferase family protein [Pasteurella bettyae]EIJ71178.1 isoprenylcysteine carboxyl methyltransferase family protein [Pasteurella bettyae CCUG 2042]SUB20985.1 isoprenylcysteine carboxyl methyltransferase family protein [Pasteurella bettyae]
MFLINILFITALCVRFYSLSISIRNEKALIQQGAIQYGKYTSILLSFAHIVFYLSAIIEANTQNVTIDTLSVIGLIILGFSLIMLFYVIHLLKGIWTVKLYILPKHPIVHSWLFKYFRHPNYFLNIIPELIGLSLFCHAKNTAHYGLPIYLCLLLIRIIQEEKAMTHLR